MTQKILKGVNFPGLPDTYMIPTGGVEVDAELKTSGMAADAAVTGNSLKVLANFISNIDYNILKFDVNEIIGDMRQY